jgi:hypothetical protein
MLSKNFDDSVTIHVTIMARIRLARIAFTKLQKDIFGTRRVALESKRIAYESLVLSLLLYGSECWVVSAENVRLLQRFHRNLRCIRIMCRVTRHHTWKQHISTEELEAKLGIHDISLGHYVHSRVLRYLPRARFSYGRADRTPSLRSGQEVRSGQVRSGHSMTPSLLPVQRCWVVDGKQPSGKTRVIYDSAVQKLLDEMGLSLLDAANKGEWHNNVAPCRGPRLLEAAARRKSDLPDRCAARTAAVELLHI